jgi:BirA family transcriptional regulator, biotin operon repressor / biotin---[acetyl-CoA-carboxylase] ligase
MSLPREEWTFDTRHVGRRVAVYDRLESTNDTAAVLAADPENAGAVVVADAQSAGRGQYGRVWNAPPGTSLLMSVLLFPPPPLRRPVVLTALAAVAVAEAIRERTGLQARIKWPNDLLLGDKKVCGILIEQGAGTVVGIGLNLNQSAGDFAAAGLPDATSLAVAAGGWLDPPTVLATVVRHLDDEYDLLLAGDVAALEADWKWRVGLLGRQVVVATADGGTTVGRLREMSFDGLEIEADELGFSAVRPELVRSIRPA